MCADYSEFFLTLTVTEGTYAIKIKNVAKFFAFRNNPIWNNKDNSLKALRKKYNKRLPTDDIKNFQKDLLELFVEMDAGIGLYQVNENLTSWEEIIIKFLQPYNLLQKEITVEIRNDNDTRFTAKEVQEFFKENKLNQVFTHPYTPQENGHIESFHAILGRALGPKEFKTINDLEQHLKHFYKIYNTKRLHGSLDHLAPDVFWKLWNQNLINMTESKNKPTAFKLALPHYQLSGNGNLREVSPELIELANKMYGPNTLIQLSVQRSPSVVSPPQN